MKYTGQEMIGSLVADFPGAAEVFKKYRIDFCCGGNRELQTVMNEMNLDSALVIADLNNAYENLISKQRAQRVTDWRCAPLTELVTHIVSTHHAYLDKELPQLGDLVLKILRVHGVHHPELSRVHKLFSALKAELESHLIKEEEVLFPLITEYAAQPSSQLQKKIFAVIDEIEGEHIGAGDILKELRVITKQFIPPTDGCATYKLAYNKLEEMENDIFQHIHLENNILHPRLGYIQK